MTPKQRLSDFYLRLLTEWLQVRVLPGSRLATGRSREAAPTTSSKANNLQRRKVPTTSWLCAKRSVVPMSSPNDLHFPLQIGVKWRDAATPFSSFCSPRSPNRTGFGMGRLKPRPTFSPHSSRYGTSSRRASVRELMLCRSPFVISAAPSSGSRSFRNSEGTSIHRRGFFLGGLRVGVVRFLQLA